MKATLEHIESGRPMSSVNYFERMESSFPPFWHFHPQIELTFILKGKGMRYVGNSISPFDDHDLVLLGSMLPHQWVTQNVHQEVQNHAYVFQFQADLFANIKDLDSLGQLFAKARHGLHFPNPTQKTINKIKTYGQNLGVSRHLAFIDILRDLEASTNMVKLADQLLTPSKSGNKISNITGFILGNLNRKISVQEVANMANLQPESFCRWFKKQMGITFINFVNKARIENAFQLLMQTDLSISQIAYQSGFETLAHFNRTFKRYKKDSPRKLRENLKS